MHTDITKGFDLDAPKLDPADIASLALDGIAEGEYEIIADDLSRQEHARLADTVAALYLTSRRKQPDPRQQSVTLRGATDRAMAHLADQGQPARPAGAYPPCRRCPRHTNHQRSEHLESASRTGPVHCRTAALGGVNGS